MYEFLHTASSSSGKSGFVTIKREDKRKCSVESLGIEGKKGEEEKKKKKGKKRQISNTPRLKGKSLLNSPGFSSTQGTSGKDWRNFSSLKKHFESKPKKLVKKEPGKKKSLKPRKRSLKDKDASLKLSPKVRRKGIETTREKIPYPYSLITSGSLPSLHNFKKKIDLIATIKYKKKPQAT